STPIAQINRIRQPGILYEYPYFLLWFYKFPFLASQKIPKLFYSSSFFYYLIRQPFSGTFPDASGIVLYFFHFITLNTISLYPFLSYKTPIFRLPNLTISE